MFQSDVSYKPRSRAPFGGLTVAGQPLGGRKDEKLASLGEDVEGWVRLMTEGVEDTDVRQERRKTQERRQRGRGASSILNF